MPRGGVGLLNRNQRAAARQLSLAAYLLSRDGRAKDEASIRESLPPYTEIHNASLAEHGDRERAGDALRKQLHRDVEALAGAGIEIEVESAREGRRYRLPAGGFSPVEVDLSREESAVLVGALRALRRDFPYAGPLRLAIANLIGAASARAQDEERRPDEDHVTLAAVATRDDEAVAGRVALLESAVSRRKRVRFDYYSISRDEVSTREVEPYTLSLLDGAWYLTGRDVGREDLRQFRLSRIRSRIVFATKRDNGDFEVPDDFERRLAGPRAPWQLGEPDRTARIRVPREVSDAARASYGPAVSLEEGDGSILVTSYSGERQLAGWVLSLGEEAKILSPDSLVDRTVEGLERIVAAHGGEPA